MVARTNARVFACSRTAVSLIIGCLLGCSASPVSFARSSQRLECKYLKKCDERGWDDAGYKTVRECRSDRLSDDELEDFVDHCDNYDPERGRLCLQGKRANLKECSRKGATSKQEDACRHVCDHDGDFDDD